MAIKKVSAKQAKANREISKVFQQILLDYDGICTGCGTTKNLTPSHIIRRSRRGDLKAEYHNIKPHCIDCHHKWDSGNLLLMFELNDFESNMRYIKKVEPELYQILWNKFHELQENFQKSV